MREAESQRGNGFAEKRGQKSTLKSDFMPSIKENMYRVELCNSKQRTTIDYKLNNSLSSYRATGCLKSEEPQWGLLSTTRDRIVLGDPGGERMVASLFGPLLV